MSRIATRVSKINLDKYSFVDHNLFSRSANRFTVALDVRPWTKYRFERGRSKAKYPPENSGCQIRQNWCTKGVRLYLIRELEHGQGCTPSRSCWRRVTEVNIEDSKLRTRENRTVRRVSGAGGWVWGKGRIFPDRARRASSVSFGTDLIPVIG